MKATRCIRMKKKKTKVKVLPTNEENSRPAAENREKLQGKKAKCLRGVDELLGLKRF